MTTFRPVPKPSAKVKAPKARKPRKPVKSVNRERQAKVRDRAYLDWIKTLPCMVWNHAYCGFFRPGRPCVEPAHVKTKGSGGGDRGNVVPLCPKHHDEAEGDVAGFNAVYSVNLKLEAARLLVKYVEAGEP